MQWFLKGETGDHSPWHIPVNKSEYVLGRNADCDLVLNDHSVSRKHCRILFRRDEPWVADLGSSNGTWVNGIKVDDERVLRHGDILKLGKLEFQFSGSTNADEEEEDKTVYDAEGIAAASFTEHYGFSDREEEVLYLLLKGVSVKEIGEKLFISAGTAKNHVLRIYKKTNTHSRIELATLYHHFQK